MPPRRQRDVSPARVLVTRMLPAASHAPRPVATVCCKHLACMSWWDGPNRPIFGPDRVPCGHSPTGLRSLGGTASVVSPEQRRRPRRLTTAQHTPETAPHPWSGRLRRSKLLRPELPASVLPRPRAFDPWCGGAGNGRPRGTGVGVARPRPGAGSVLNPAMLSACCHAAPVANIAVPRTAPVITPARGPWGTGGGSGGPKRVPAGRSADRPPLIRPGVVRPPPSSTPALPGAWAWC